MSIFSSRDSYYDFKDPYSLKFEHFADACFAPIRWLSNDTIKSYQINTDYSVTNRDAPAVSRFIKIARVIIAIATIIPLTMIGLVARGIASCDEVVLARRDFIFSTNKEKAYRDILTEHFAWHRAPEGASIEIKKEKGKTWGEVGLITHKVRYYPYHSNSGKIFNRDPKWLIRMKSIGILTFVMPTFTVLRTVIMAIKAIWKVTIELPYKILDGRIEILKAGKEAYKAIENIVRPILYYLPMSLAISLAIVAPFWGKYHYNKLEARLNMFCLPCFKPLATIPAELRDQKIIKVPDSLDRRRLPEAVVDSLHMNRMN